MKYDLIIIGGGPAGLTAAIYAARYKLKTLIITKIPGGLASTAHKICNFPTYEDISGFQLMKKMEDHVKELNIGIIYDEVTEIKNFKIKTKNKIFEAKKIILALGTERKKLGLKNEMQFLGKGLSYCATCLPPNESIIINSSIRNIGKITPMNKVLTMDGTYQNINGFTKRDYKGKLIKIRTRYFTEPVYLTPNHPVSKSTRKYYPLLTFSKPEWVPAGELNKGDCVYYPIIKETIDKDYFLISDYLKVKKEGDYILPRINTHTSNKIPNKIIIDKEFMRLCGYYISEGYKSNHELLFSFNKNEKNYIEDVIKILKDKFTVEPRVKTIKNVCRIAVSSKIIADLFNKFFDSYAHKKELPPFFMILPIDKQKEFIKGFWRGDGCKREKDFCFVTVSRKLTYQLRDLLLRQGIIPSIQKRELEKLNKRKSIIEGREILFNNDKYQIHIGGPFLGKIAEVLEEDHELIHKRKRVNYSAWIKNGSAILPIKDIEYINYEGPVLNIGVENNNTYVAKNFLVHNCDGPLYKNKDVAVIGGSNAALSSALLLADYANQVYIIYRKDKFRAEPAWIDQLKKNKKIKTIFNDEVIELKGNKFLEAVKLKSRELKIQGLFVEIGSIPDKRLIPQLKIKTDSNGYIITDKQQKTNINGIFAAGDITNNTLKQIITACGEGATAAHSVYEELNLSNKG